MTFRLLLAMLLFGSPAVLSAQTGSLSEPGPHETIFPGLSGNQLLDSLAVHYRPEFVYNYDDARDQMFTFTDNNSNEVICVYTGDLLEIPADAENPRADFANPANWNTEHVWPQSKGALEGTARRDLHHLRSARADVNTSRSNNPFVFLEPFQVNRWWKDDDSQVSQPSGNLGLWSRAGDGSFQVRDDQQGDVARAKFYFYTIYRAEAEAADASFFSGMQDVLRTYHNQDMVDATESERNQRIASLQGNTNPFVTDTTLVRRAFFENFNPDEGWYPRGYFVDFESDSKGGYAAATLSLNDKEWILDNVLIGGADSDQYIGSRSARMRVPAEMEMIEDKTDGLGTLSFLYALSEFSGDNQPSAPILVVEYSTDAGSSWTPLGAPVDLAGVSELTKFRYEINDENNGRIRIRTIDGNDGRRLNIDDLHITDFLEEDPVTIGPGEQLPRGYALEQNYPNPFNPTTQIRFNLPESGEVRLDVFNIQGQRVATLVNEGRSAGTHTVSFDASALSSGVYLYRLQAGAQVFTKKMTFIK